MYLHKDLPRFIIYKNKKMISTMKYINSFKKKGFNIEIKPGFGKNKQFVLLMTKNTSKKLNLNLKYDGNSTLNISALKFTDDDKYDSSVWWSSRSVFKVK